MQQQVIQLRKKVKMLEYDLCQRTRNYMHHFKKTPPKVQPLTMQQQTQTDYVIVTYVQQGVNTDTQQPNQFANITLEAIQAKRSNNPQTVKQPLTLDISQLQAQSSKAIQCQTHNHRQQIDQIASEIRVMKEQLEATRTPKNKGEMRFQFVGLGEGKLNVRENDISLLGENSMRDLPIQMSSGMKMSQTGMSSSMKTPQPVTSTNQFIKKPQPPQFQTISQQSQHRRKGSFQSHLTTKTKQQIQQETLTKQLKIMKKQIKKLKHKLEEELKISSQTKEALLISEEENYNFRLKIQKLNKEIMILTEGEDVDVKQGSFGDEGEAGNQAVPLVLKEVESNQSESTKDEVEKWKGQLEKYEEHIFMLQGVKRDYLKKCIQAKEDICKLKGENQLLVKQINELKRQLSQTNHTKGNQQIITESLQTNEEPTPSYSSSPLLPTQLHSPTFHQHLKQKIHQISNCLPVTQTHEDSCLFRPETVEDIIKMLERILEFCRNIEAWERDKIAAIEKQRANLLQVLSGVIMRYPQARHQIAELISQIEELKYLVNFLNRDQKRGISTERDNMSPERDNRQGISPQRDNLRDISPQRPCSGSVQISITPASQVPIQQLN